MRALLLACVACSTSPAPIDSAFDSAVRIPNITSLSVRENGEVVREACYQGTDADTAHDVRSVTKTVTSLLVGIALDLGCLTSIDQPIGALLGDQAPTDPVKAAITVRDVLTMTSGLQWDENGAVGDYNTWSLAPSQVDFVLARPIVVAPGTTFNYNSGALHLLSVILTRACAPTATFAAQHLFVPLGIASSAWETDNQNIANGAAGLQLSTTEMASLGQLLLDGGKRGATQVVSSAYLADATTAQVPTGDTSYDTQSYGFGTWIGLDPYNTSFTLAEGYGGQFIFVVPASRAVIVATTHWQGIGAQAGPDYDELYQLILTQILPAL